MSKIPEGKPSVHEHVPKIETPQKIKENKTEVNKPNQVKNPIPKKSNIENKKPFNSKKK